MYTRIIYKIYYSKILNMIHLKTKAELVHMRPFGVCFEAHT